MTHKTHVFNHPSLPDYADKYFVSTNGDVTNMQTGRSLNTHTTPSEQKFVNWCGAAVAIGF